jgi:putative heme-binding domain-containing protein
MKHRVFLFALLLIAVCPVSLVMAQSGSLATRLKLEDVDKLAEDAVRFGDPMRGALAFYQPTMNCAKCHEPVAGRRLGPDLSEPRDVTVSHLVDSVLQPSAEIKQGFETIAVQMEDGRLITGIKTGETADAWMIDRIEQSEQPVEIDKHAIDDWKQTTKSTMPEDLANQLTDRQQFLDLISYLSEIAFQGPGRARQLRPAAAMFAQIPLPEYEQHVDHAGLIRDWNNLAFSRGEEIYRLRCASCHGTLEEEGSMPTSLRFASGKFKHGNDPFTMYNTLTHGFGMMNAQRWMVPQQKYAVIYYLRKQFLEPHNPGQLFEVTEDYLAGLPAGNTRGPKPELPQPWTKMDYGPSWFNTIEVSDDSSNIAQKGITLRLDDGPGGLESGKYWLMYDHDTMRVAAAWSGKFIDFNGIHFNGVHGRHPKITGQIHFENPVGPGWANPDNHSFEDDRLVGGDGRHYGPLNRDWAHYSGMYRFGNQSILKYTVADTEILEAPSLRFVDNQPVFVRTLNLAPHDRELVLQLAQTESDLVVKKFSDHAVGLVPAPTGDDSRPGKVDEAIVLDGATFAQTAADGFDFQTQDFSIVAKLKTSDDGTILAFTKDQPEWLPFGQTFFVRDGRLTFDMGWVGAVKSTRRVADDQWHDVAVTRRARDGQIHFYVDGEQCGKGSLLAEEQLEGESVVRIGFTNDNFPATSHFKGELKNLGFYQRLLSDDELKSPSQPNNDQLISQWTSVHDGSLIDATGQEHTALLSESANSRPSAGVIVSVDSTGEARLFNEQGNLRLRVAKSSQPTQLTLRLTNPDPAADPEQLAMRLDALDGLGDLRPLTTGGPPNYPQILETQTIFGNDEGPFAVDVFARPIDNPWNCQLRLTGLDFHPDGNSAVVSTWDGSVFKVSGLLEKTTRWQRIAAGLFQPLGIKWIGDKIYVACRDQICLLHDLNGDGEADFYENFNNDHQVTEHFHEFAMGLQTDAEGNFYYAKSARHALPAVVPHHGTLLKVSADGSRTEIVANGFRAANGVCINPDGTFMVTDQEGHWTPKNRINWVKPGGFYGNMLGYHDVTDESDAAMQQPLCWITNSFDRSPAELLWVDSDRWGNLDGSLLNFSYGYGKVYIVPHEKIGDQMQGGMCAFDIPQFPTGVMRGRFNREDGQLYCCGMFAWSSTQQEPGGFYRIRRTDKPVYLPIELHARKGKLQIEFSGPLDASSVSDVKNWSIRTWELKRTANYGSDHFNEQELEVSAANLGGNDQVVELDIPNLAPCWCMEITYALKTADGQRLLNKIHNTIHTLGD